MNNQPNDHVDLDRAYMLLRDMSVQKDNFDATGPQRVAELVAAQEEPEPILRALGAVINELTDFVDEGYRLAVAEAGDVEEAVRDALHIFQPAIITRLAKTPGIDRGIVPAMAGALTAASLGFDCYEWRSSVGTWDRSECAAWVYAAWYLCDLIGHVSDQPDLALSMIGSILDHPLE